MTGRGKFDRASCLWHRVYGEFDRRFRETERLLKQQCKKTDEQIGKLGNRLGEFVEWQVRIAVVNLFQKRGIDVHEFLPDVSVKRAKCCYFK